MLAALLIYLHAGLVIALLQLDPRGLGTIRRQKGIPTVCLVVLAFVVTVGMLWPLVPAVLVWLSSRGEQATSNSGEANLVNTSNQ